MISLHNIFSIAKYERKTLFRSWFFRIFSVLSLLILFGMNFGVVIDGRGGESWAVRAIPSAIPYMNLLMLNVAQAVIAVFLASDFLKRDKKLDTTEVIYMRSMTNGEYVIGKTLGNMQVFMLLNFAVVAMSLIFNALAENTAINWAAYGMYLLLISIPTLVFIMGLSFLLMSVIRNQAITFILILGYIGITLFLLQAKYYYIFDYMAFNIPMLSSEIIGFGNLEVIITHRGIYFGLGLGFIFLTIFLLKRLPQSESMTVFSLIFSVLFLAGSGYLGYNHINQFKINEKHRNEVVELNNTYVNQPVPSVKQINLHLNHLGETIQTVSEVTVVNETGTTLDKLVFSLNDGLNISEIKLDGNPARFLRKKHLVILSENILLEPEQEAVVEFNYMGTINENSCYLDIDELTMQEKYGKFILNVDKRFAFISPEYVLLTPEANWYPRTGVTYSTENVRWIHPEFIDFNLNVKTSDGLIAVSQGEINEVAEGEFSFKNETPLTQITLAIGNYRQKKLTTDDMEFGIWHLEGHDFFSEQFPESKDTLGALLTERFEDFERDYNLNYAFSRFNLVEVPAQFKSFQRAWSSSQEYVQPEMVLIPEKGYMLRQADVEKQKENVARWSRDGSDMTPDEKERRVIYEFTRSFVSETSREFRGGPGGMNSETELNPYFIFPMLYNFQNNIRSDRWPITNRIFEAYLKSQNLDMRSLFMNSSGITPDIRANISLQDSTFQEILNDPNQKSILNNVIKLKGDVLFSMIQWKAGPDEFKDFLTKMLQDNKFRDIRFEEFDRMIVEEFGIELTPIMDEWFKTKSLPGFLVSPVTAVKVKDKDAMKTMVKLKITNFSDTDGLVKITFRLGSFGRGGRGGGPGGNDMIDKLIFLEAHKTKDLSYLFNVDPRMVIVNTMTSKNIPQTMTTFMRDIPEDLKAVPFEGEIDSDVSVKSNLDTEIIVDNEDPEFEYTQLETQSLLEKLIVKDSESETRFAPINRWRSPSTWTATTDTRFYGEYIRSAYYIKGGEGDLKAMWHVPLKRASYYDVYYHLYKQRSWRRGSDEEQGNYSFTIHSDDGAEEINLEVHSAEEGWNHLGSFSFSGDTALIELSNRTKLRSVFADAVKLIEIQ